MDEQNNPRAAESAPESAEPARDVPTTSTNLFFGPDGLRAGWRVVVYFGVFYLLAWLIAQTIFPFLPRHASRLWFYMAAEGMELVAALGAALVMARIERREFSSYGLPVRAAFGKLFWVGAVWGFAGMTLLLVVMHLAHVFDFGAVVLSGYRGVKFGVFWAVFFLAVGLFEEFYFRGYPLFTLSRGLGFLDENYGSEKTRSSKGLSFWGAAVLLSLFFAARHITNPGENWIGITAVAVIGMFFCLTIRRTGSLWFAVGFHSSWDWCQSFLYSVPDSGGVVPGHLLSSSFHGRGWLTGGSVGPEGSVLVFLIIAILAAAFDRVYRWPVVKQAPIPPETGPPTGTP
jgi:membrane protease YdiL (CAAX protease family)